MANVLRALLVNKQHWDVVNKETFEITVANVDNLLNGAKIVALINVKNKIKMRIKWSVKKLIYFASTNKGYKYSSWLVVKLPK